MGEETREVEKKSMLQLSPCKGEIHLHLFDDWDDLQNSQHLHHKMDHYEAMVLVRDILLIIQGNM